MVSMHQFLGSGSNTYAGFIVLGVTSSGHAAHRQQPLSYLCVADLLPLQARDWVRDFCNCSASVPQQYLCAGPLELQSLKLNDTDFDWCLPEGIL